MSETERNYDQGQSNAEPTERDAPFHVVAIGASAGGLPALEELFTNIACDIGAAFVVIQHLSPDFESNMDELLSRHTELPVVTVRDGMPVEPGKVYLPPASSDMFMRGGRLFLTERERTDVLRLPIDQFFRSMAQDIGRRAIGIILSGTGSDGSRGVGEIHQAGGLVISQATDTARFDGMPRSAESTGVVDLVLPPEEIAGALADTIGQLTNGSPFFEETPADESSVQQILTLLDERMGIDFGAYKATTVGRRIWRRVALGRHENLEKYVRVLRSDPEELETLFRDLLIGVTRFFRDPEAFECLATEVIGELVSSADPDGMRVWVPACSTGEEVYSIGMLILEELDRQDRSDLPVKLFATDVDEAALRAANAALYPEEALLEVNDDRRERFFREESPGYFRIAKDLRERVVFARHDVLHDPPFTRLDLVSCRNLLIYLQQSAQSKAVALFHFGLKRDGILFLGGSESPPASIADEFAKVSSRHRLFRKRRDVRLGPDPSRYSTGPPRASHRVWPREGKIQPSRLLDVYEELIGQHVPPSLLVDQAHEVMHVFAGAERLIRVPGGRMSTNVLDLVHPDLKMAISGALRHAEEEGADAQYAGVRIGDGEEAGLYEVAAKPVPNARETYYLVTIEEMDVEVEDPVELNSSDGDVSREYIESIESELRYTRENLRATVEELETSNEELQATNEELVASNEELQSTNEELHSVNEELYTVNSEYQAKIAELTSVTDDLNNLVASIDIGVIFVDADLRIRKFTPQMAEAFDLLPRDVGRPLDAFAQKIDDADIIADTERVQATSEAVEKEVEDADGNSHFLRVLPYRTESGEIAGVVITLIDISALKRAEASASRLSDIVEQAHDAVVAVDLEGRVVSWNRGATDLYGVDADDALGESILEVLRPNDPELATEVLEAAKRGERSSDVEAIYICPDGSEVVASQSVSPLSDGDGEITGVAIIARDITERRRARTAVEKAVEHRDMFLALLSHELRNPLMALMTASRLFLEDEVAPDDQERAAQVVRRQTVHMARLLDDLLDVSRMRRDKIEMRREVIDLRDTIRDVIDEVAPRAEAAELAFDVDVGAQPVPVLADRARLKQVQANLLTNAFKYTPPGGRVKLTVGVEDGAAVARVEDDGDGIPPDVVDTIFDPFVQGESPTRGPDESSLGLGLALVRSIVKAHGGEVSAASDGRGEGATFEVRLPLQPVADVHPNLGPDGADATDLPVEQHRVLLVEDQDDNRELLELALRSYGFDVCSVSCGEDAVEALGSDEYTIGLIDIGLPDMSGLDVARHARTNGGAEMLLLAVTGYGRQKDREEIMDAGFDLHIVKPVDVGKLVDAISDHSCTRMDFD